MDLVIKYIEQKIDGVRGIGRIGFVSLSKTGKTIYYNSRALSSLKGSAAKANFFDNKTLEEFWVSNPTLDGSDSLFPAVIEIDENAREEYWIGVRGMPKNISAASFKSPGKSKKEREAVENAVKRRDVDRRFRAP